jgi:hypothetical protein
MGLRIIRKQTPLASRRLVGLTALSSSASPVTSLAFQCATLKETA